MLALRHPFHAYRHLRPLVTTQCVRRPRVWLRLAECCLHMYTDFNRSKDRREQIDTICGRGAARRFLLVTESRRRASEEPLPDPCQTPRNATECLQTATVALKNALLECEGQKVGNSVMCDADAKHLHDIRLATVEDAVLVKLSYALLLRKDYAQALCYAQDFLRKHCIVTSLPEESEWMVQLPSVSQRDPAQLRPLADVKAVGTVRLAVMYAAECLTSLNRCEDANLLLTGFLNGQFLARGASKTRIVKPKYAVDLARKVKPPLANRRPPCTIEQLVTAGYDVSPWSVLPFRSEVSGMGDARLWGNEDNVTLIEAQAELYANLACAYATEADKVDDFNVVASLIDVALAMHPKNVAAQRTRLYLKLRSKKHADAMLLLKG